MKSKLLCLLKAVLCRTNAHVGSKRSLWGAVGGRGRTASGSSQGPAALGGDLPTAAAGQSLAHRRGNASPGALRGPASRTASPALSRLRPQGNGCSSDVTDRPRGLEAELCETRRPGAWGQEGKTPRQGQDNVLWPEARPGWQCACLENRQAAARNPPQMKGINTALQISPGLPFVRTCSPGGRVSQGLAGA